MKFGVFWHIQASDLGFEPNIDHCHPLEYFTWRALPTFGAFFTHLGLDVTLETLVGPHVWVYVGVL